MMRPQALRYDVISLKCWGMEVLVLHFNIQQAFN